MATLSAVALAAQSLLVRVSTKNESVSSVITLIFGVNILVLVPVSVVFYYPTFQLTPTAVVSFGIAGLLGSFLARYLLFVGIERVGASRAEALKSTFPLVAVVGAVVVLGEALTATRLFGVLLIIAGAAAVSWDAQQRSLTPGGRSAATDISIPVLAAILLGIDPVFTKIGFAEGTPAVVGVTVRVLAAAAGFGLYLAIHSYRTGRWEPVTPTRWIWAAGVANTVYLAAYLAALSLAPVAIVAPILGASPLFVLVGSALFLRADEEITLQLVGAVVVLVVGVVLTLTG